MINYWVNNYFWLWRNAKCRPKYYYSKINSRPWSVLWCFYTNNILLHFIIILWNVILLEIYFLQILCSFELLFTWDLMHIINPYTYTHSGAGIRSIEAPFQLVSENFSTIIWHQTLLYLNLWKCFICVLNIMNISCWLFQKLIMLTNSSIFEFSM